MKYKAGKAEMALIAIVVMSLALRLSSLDWEALSWNEGTLLGGAQEYAKGNFIYNFNDFVTPPLMKYIGAVVLNSTGFTEIGLRAISALFGTLTVILTFYFGKKFYDKRTAIFASGLVGFSIIHLAFSRMYLGEATLGFFYLASLFLYLNIIETKDTKKLPLLLGTTLALATLTKYLAIHLILALLVHALLTKQIRFRWDKKFSLETEKYVIKVILVFILIFFLLWPFSLYPIKIKADISVVGFENRQESVTLNVPQILLSPQEYITAGLGKEEVRPPAAVENSIITVPFAGYFALFSVKELLLFPILILLGLYVFYKQRNKTDTALLTFVAVFLFMLWLQKYGFSYRYLTVIIPLFALMAARSLQLVKSNTTKNTVVAVVLLAALVNAAFVFPYYTREYNELDNTFNLKSLDSEMQMLDGYREGIEFAIQNCPRATGLFAATVVNYIDNPESFVVETPSAADLPLCVYDTPQDTRSLESVTNLGATCQKIKTIEVDGVEFRVIYYCQ